MSALFPEMRRPLPSFKKWLEEQGVSDLSEGADAFAALRQLAEITLAQRADGLARQEECFLHLWQGLLLATVELSNIEVRNGVDHHTILAMLPRAMAAAAMYGVASACITDSNWRQIAKVIAEEFRAGTKASADQLFNGYREGGQP